MAHLPLTSNSPFLDRVGLLKTDDKRELTATMKSIGDGAANASGLWLGISKIGIGENVAITATSTHINYINTLSSNAQDQINGKQSINADLTAIIGLSAVNDDIIQRKGGVWVNRTIAQYKSDLNYSTTNVSEGTNLYYTNARSISSTLTGFVSGSGTVTSSDTILSALQKINGNVAAITGNATHTGDADGATILTLNKVAITNKTLVTAVGTDYVLISDTSDSGNLKKALVSDITGAGGAVASVNGFTGTVVLTTTDIAEGTNLYYTSARFDSAFGAKSTTNLSEGTNLYFTNARSISSTLTGFVSGSGTVTAADTILSAIQKINGNVAAILGGAIYQGTWNASTNSPSITGSSGTKGHYYVVSVAGSTSIDGITDWKVGDWIIYNGSVWQKVDNTDAVSSVNGQIGAVSLTTTDIAEGTNLYYTSARSISSTLTGFVSGSGTVTSSDTVLSAIQKINGNVAAITGNATHTGDADGATILTLNKVAITNKTLVTAVGTDYVLISDTSDSGNLKKALVSDITGAGGAVASVNGFTGTVVLTTTDIAEGTNLYYTSARFDSAFGAKSTTNLSEGTNLYFTNARSISSTLTGFVSGSGTVTAADTILSAIQKINGNVAAIANKTKTVLLSNWSIMVDSSGNCFLEPSSIKQTNDRYHTVKIILKDSGTKTGFGLMFIVPDDYVGTPVVGIVWGSNATSGANVVFDIDYTCNAFATTLDASSDEENVTATTADSSTSQMGVVTEIALTAGNLSSNNKFECNLSRDGASANDTLASDIYIASIYFKYNTY